jgi:hypothetical protein
MSSVPNIGRAGLAGYPTLELGFPGTEPCPDVYTKGSTLFCGGATRLRIQTALATVVLQFGEGFAGIVWSEEEPVTPVTGTIPRNFDAVRVRNMTAGQKAQVLLTAIVT